MTLSLQLKSEIEKLLTQFRGRRFHLEHIESVAGGSINSAFRIGADDQSYFLKLNTLACKPMFAAESADLEHLSNAGVRVPEVVGIVEDENVCALVLTWVVSGEISESFWKKFGHSVAQLHKTSEAYFGREHDNFIGTLAQINSPTLSWMEFFVANRLRPQIRLAGDMLDESTKENLDLLIERIGVFDTKEKPALLHGDLWSGNFLVEKSGDPVLIDPSVYYGNREVDLAMAKLFGGFPQVFFDAYATEFPLFEGWKERIHLWNLYPILVHMNLFGEGYLRKLKNNLDYLGRIS